MDRESIEALMETEKMAIDAGICSYPNIETRPTIEPLAHIDPTVQRLLEEMPPATEIPRTLQYNDPARDTVAQKYQEARAQDWPFGQFNLPVNQAVEVARFRVKRGAVGVVKGIWTHIESLSNIILRGSNPPVVIDPLVFPRNFYNYTWHLRLHQRDPRFERPWWAGFWAGIPGNPFYEMPYWSDIRFPWGFKSDVFWLVPGGFDLRLVLQGGSLSNFLGNVRGRMWGYTQPHMRLDTRYNVRHGWS